MKKSILLIIACLSSSYCLAVSAETSKPTLQQADGQESELDLIKKSGNSKLLLKMLISRFLKMDTLPPSLKNTLLQLPGMQEFDIRADIAQGLIAFTSTVSVSGNPLHLELLFAQDPTRIKSGETLAKKETIKVDENAQPTAQNHSSIEKLVGLFEKKGLQLRVVVALPEGFLLSNLSEELRPFDALHLSKTYLIITKDAYTDPAFGKIKAGVNFSAELQLGALEGTLEGLNTFLSKIPHIGIEAGKGTIRLGGLLTPKFIGSKLFAELPGELAFGDKGKRILVTTTPLTLEIEITGVKTSALNVALLAGMRLDLKGQAEPLNFKTIFTIKSNTSIGIAGAMDGLAQIVPHVPVKVGNLWIGGSINLLTWATTGGIFPFEGIDIGGTVDIFDQRIDLKSCLAFSETDATLVLLGNYQGSLNTITLLETYRKYTEMMRQFYHSHTSALDSAIELSRDMEEKIAQHMPNIALTKLHLFISIAPTKCMDDYYPAGLGLSGAASVGPLDGEITFNFGTDSIKGEGAIRPMKFGHLIISGKQPTDDAQLKLAIDFDKTTENPAELAQLVLDGTVRLDVPPGFSAGQTIDIDATHINLAAHGKLGSLDAQMDGSLALVDPFASKIMISLDSAGIEQFVHDLESLIGNVAHEAITKTGGLNTDTQAKIKAIQEKIKQLQEEYLYPNQDAIHNAQRCAAYTAGIVPGGKKVRAALERVVTTFAKTVHVPDILIQTAKKLNIVIPGKIEDIHQAMLVALRSVLEAPQESVSFITAAKSCALTAKNITQLPSKMIVNAMAITLIQILEKERTDLELLEKGARVTLSVGNQIISISKELLNRLVAQTSNFLDIKKIYASFGLNELPVFNIEGTALGKPIHFTTNTLFDYGKIAALIIHALT